MRCRNEEKYIVPSIIIYVTAILILLFYIYRHISISPVSKVLL